MLRRRQRVPSASFADEVVSHLPPLYATALRLTRSRADAEDLVQDVVVRALRSAHQFTPGTNLKAWLYTILHNAWKNRRRDVARTPVEVDSDRVEAAIDMAGSEVETPERMLLRRSLDADLQAALDALPEVFREAVWLRDVEELSYAEIAQVLGVPVGTIMSRISRGRRLLCAGLGEAAPGQEPAAGPGVAGAGSGPASGDAGLPGRRTRTDGKHV
jgi:RNA polymerase sigma-70 factor, ECF subfamily